MVGIAAWLIAQTIAVGLAGAGHGWMAPFWLSMSLVALYPIVFIRAFASSSSSYDMVLILLAVAFVLDLLLVANITGVERHYFLNVWQCAQCATVLWILLWLGWHVVAIVPLLTRRR
jgi:hypothetical protein